MYKQCMDLQLFTRYTEHANAWMTKQETRHANEDLCDKLDRVKTLFQAFDEFATKLIENKHYAADDIVSIRDQVLSWCNRL